MNQAWAGILGSLLLPAWAAVASAGDAAPGPSAVRGKRLFLQCAACHDLKPGVPPKIGPHLQGVLGRRAGSVPGIVLSPQLRDSGIVWTAESLDRWLEKPSGVVPGTLMVFAGVAKADDRASLIAYLQQESGAAGNGQ